MQALALLAFLLVAANLAVAQQLSPAEREILMLQDQRSLGDGKLVSHLSNADPRLRSRAAMALANLQDTSTVQAVLPLLKDPEAIVRESAAFALGQIGSNAAQDSLLTQLKIETNPDVLVRILEALGKVGGGRALYEVAEYKPSTADSSSLRAEAAISIARFALRGLKNERSIWRCFDLAGDPDSKVRWSALYALWRVAPHGLIDVEIAKREGELSKLVSDPDPDVRANLLTLLGRSQSSYALEILRKALGQERLRPEWRVQVQLVRALAAHVPDNPELLRDLVQFLNSSSDHVKMAALIALSGLPKEIVQTSPDTALLKPLLLRLASSSAEPAEMTRGEASVALAKLFPDDFVRSASQLEQGMTQRQRTKILEGLSFIPTGRSLAIIMNALEDSSARVAMAGWDFIRRFLTPSTLARMRSGDPSWEDARRALYRKSVSALQRGDMGITHLVSNALGDTTYFALFKDSGQSDTLILALLAAYGRLASPDDVEAMQSAVAAMGELGDARFVPVLEKALQDPDKTVATFAAAALKKITQQDYSARIPRATKALHTDYDWELFESLRPAHTATLRTSKGVIKVELRKNGAPFTVLSFVRLARRGFYSGLTFHRVVPNFVIQGGDPRGDGWGGPGYAIRSEFSLARFDRGAVGIASAGKDTEGCQFFITHSPVPHLDGRYTVFAVVVEGQDVVDRIQVGDTITEITVD